MASGGDEAPILIIGIDFGTTYSGVAYSRRKNPPKLITNWKNLRHFNQDKEKVPSAVFYDLMTEGDFSWGYEVPIGEDVLRWFKLLLVDENDPPFKIRTSPHVMTARALIRQLKKTPVEVIGDYLGALWKHSRENIMRAVGQRVFKIARLHFVVTLPAIWPHYARTRMEEALMRAGIREPRPAGETIVDFISEPEAAALACLEGSSDAIDLKPGQHLIVCDAGGGTVDIITYKIIKMDPLTVQESARGDGDLCGAMFLDESFALLLKEKIPADIQAKMGDSGLRKFMHDEWEHGIKTSVDKDRVVNGKYHPPRITIEASTVRDKVYRPQITRIEKLVEEQIKQVKEKFRRKPKYLMLVGGFGKSKFLYECLQEKLGKKIEILQDSNSDPWTAVVRGAVYHGLVRSNMTDNINVSIESRISRYSYGTLVNAMPFDATMHEQEDRFYCSANQACPLTLVAYLENETVSAHKPHKFTCWQELSSPDDEVTVDIVFSDAETPPKRQDGTVKPLCEIKVPHIPNWDKLPLWKNSNGEEFRHFGYELCMVSDGTSLDFSVYHNKRKIAAQSASFESSGCASAGAASAGGSASRPPRASNRQMGRRPDPDYNEESGSEEEDGDFEMED
ncbi:uncharacterized protein NECHADRAFT_79049 [Fusarium vanettenii 77-13-4]|uniref:Uncharacterized protein n=1 Tax=Fusarium vanettenii (strain ATCC MYA-4622 / CBS 123669 / FGSC 9596 / NRRL 45880 / 77-13-4) TaxID=660122 RepID=C7YQB7_FUSV7|nr:uncharacterized protein NECHADRAFT_79049 [Fusarium vanettenii 77-13-4]EEU45996.1 hypothetical protein NECHADRAFT_79049 [Fusarium vanettenii 77-13-4]